MDNAGSYAAHAADTTANELALLRIKNERLVEMLQAARAKIADLDQQLESLAQPPGTFATYLGKGADGTIEVMSAGRKYRINAGPELDVGALRPGQEVALNEAMTAISASGWETTGEIVTVKDVLDDGRVVVVGRADDERVLRLAGPLLDGTLRAGDAVTADTKAGFAFERIAKAEVEELVLEEVPDIEYSDIGGLGSQIDQIRDAVELPFAHPDLYREHGLRPPKGILLYGPPGCGKTLIAKAVAHSLASARGEQQGRAQRSYFLNVKGPELLNKYVGETERHIRLIFSRAREKASAGTPVVVFFDEMESLFRTRGTGLSSDVETTIVPQLLAEIDGVERLDNVIVIGASNREDMIDPAILRPGRLDVKIKVERPDAAAAADILAKYLTVELPISEDEVAACGGDANAAVARMREAVVDRIYARVPDNEFLEVTYASGDKEVLYFKDFNSGAMIQNIVDRAKKMAIKAFLDRGERGITTAQLLAACLDEFRENEDLPNTTNPDDWARISGKKGERIVFIRTIASDRANAVRPGADDAQRPADTIAATGTYL
ncbi:proteasome ATPase [Rarobacter incanus]|uniref:AAA ATPase forming ring-shaped complexes n=1 Tax=Rarobacter incanus TaxID=153494 RepID=A0A542SLY9_9MICO|nr:proteasome ATPase [Rarobacter incanus]TQK75632.1 proteasome-associated ATPase [Rarobacter incanus]